MMHYQICYPSSTMPTVWKTISPKNMAKDLKNYNMDVKTAIDKLDSGVEISVGCCRYRLHKEPKT